jgi:hypothetical protein
MEHEKALGWTTLDLAGACRRGRAREARRSRLAGYLTHMEKRMAGTGANAAIERWEDEGGRALAPEEAMRAGPGDLPGSDPLAARSQARSARERATRSSA